MPTTLQARSIKLVVVLDTAAVRSALAQLQRVERRIPLAFAVAGRTLTADFAPKSIRRCFATIDEHGAGNVAVILQGKLLANNSVAEAGLVAQLKIRKPEQAEAA
jgi:UDP-N-acetylmuramate-alanine ligase